jgi:hypothetical protein
MERTSSDQPSSSRDLANVRARPLASPAKSYQNPTELVEQLTKRDLDALADHARACLGLLGPTSQRLSMHVGK